jgi:hypothetical protein
MIVQQRVLLRELLDNALREKFRGRKLEVSRVHVPKRHIAQLVGQRELLYPASCKWEALLFEEAQFSFTLYREVATHIGPELRVFSQSHHFREFQHLQVVTQLGFVQQRKQVQQSAFVWSSVAFRNSHKGLEALEIGHETFALVLAQKRFQRLPKTSLFVGGGHQHFAKETKRQVSVAKFKTALRLGKVCNHSLKSLCHAGLLQKAEFQNRRVRVLRFQRLFDTETKRIRTQRFH